MPNIGNEKEFNTTKSTGQQLSSVHLTKLINSQTNSLISFGKILHRTKRFPLKRSDSGLSSDSSDHGPQTGNLLHNNDHDDDDNDSCQDVDDNNKIIDVNNQKIVDRNSNGQKLTKSVAVITDLSKSKQKQPPQQQQQKQPVQTNRKQSQSDHDQLSLSSNEPLFKMDNSMCNQTSDSDIDSNSKFYFVFV